jgi:hypothetical protein
LTVTVTFPETPIVASSPGPGTVAGDQLAATPKSLVPLLVIQFLFAIPASLTLPTGVPLAVPRYIGVTAEAMPIGAHASRAKQRREGW